MSPTSPRASAALRTFPYPRWCHAAATIPADFAPAAANAPDAGASLDAPCMTWAMSWPDGRSTWSLPTPSITARTAVATSPPICPTWPCPSACTPAVSSELAVRLVAEDGLPYQAASWHLWRDHRVFVPYATIQNWVEAAGEKKAEHASRPAYLDEALADFSGYLAIDEVYDGPFCILSVVDNRRYNRLAFRVLDHDPTQDDIRAFLTEVQRATGANAGLVVRGITTDGSPLYPKVLKELWPDVPPPDLSGSTSSRRSPRRSCMPWRSSARR